MTNKPGFGDDQGEAGMRLLNDNEVYCDSVGQFWRPHKLSQRKLNQFARRVSRMCLTKPRMRVFSNPEYGLFAAAWLPK